MFYSNEVRTVIHFFTIDLPHHYSLTSSFNTLSPKIWQHHSMLNTNKKYPSPELKMLTWNNCSKLALWQLLHKTISNHLAIYNQQHNKAVGSVLPAIRDNGIKSCNLPLINSDTHLRTAVLLATSAEKPLVRLIKIFSLVLTVLRANVRAMF